jgi:hypothetical protein
MSEQMADFVTRTPFQSIFIPGHSTMTALVRVFDDIRLNLKLNWPTILVLLDFSKVSMPRWRRLFHFIFFSASKGR